MRGIAKTGIILVALSLVLLSSFYVAQKNTEPIRIITNQNVLGNTTFISESASTTGGIIIPILEENCFQYEETGWVCHNINAGTYPQLPDITQEQYSIMTVPRIIIGNKSSGRAYWLTCTTSMYPTMFCNQEYVAVRVYDDRGTVKVGEIIWFKLSEGEQYLHRINVTETNEQGFYYLTKGDNNIYLDNWIVRPNQIQFKVVGRYIE